LAGLEEEPVLDNGHATTSGPAMSRGVSALLPGTGDPEAPSLVMRDGSTGLDLGAPLLGQRPTGS
jgi:hypothetical protein